MADEFFFFQEPGDKAILNSFVPIALLYLKISFDLPQHPVFG